MAKEKKRILIIEDDELIAFVLQEYINKSGHELIKTVANGEDAVQAAGELNPDVIISDIILNGGMSGVDAIEQILQNIEASVIYMTSHTDPKYKAMADRTPHTAYIIKPVKFNELVNILDNC